MIFINCLCSLLTVNFLLLNLPLCKRDFNNFLDNLKQYKMNEIVNKFLLAEDSFMPEIYSRQPVGTCVPFTKIKERIQNFKETGGLIFAW